MRRQHWSSQSSDKPALMDWIARIKARPAYQKAIPETTQRLPKPDWN